ncbi:myo-inositol 2-dehydrogenase-like [Acropora millepora]|uniref:myo-inositol 2-dehydrogenase-like n=1 Tax=Acropora millepora TaxID=45264 RepID=UPI001CF48B95|nr:myo-inositol 2-dehydrogenase-like [Acropora millepora]XP_044173199.1 myo-inositol 2-dehydrogenase-like [Acropora millepora]
MNSKSPVGFVLFGMGRIGHTHANSLIREPLAQLKYIVDVEVDKVREFVASNFLDTKIVLPSELETVLADSSVDAAVVCTPTDFHEDLVVRCLKAGKAVFCEKPIAKSLEAIERCYNLALSKNIPLFCGFNRRFDPTVSSVATRVKSGDIGQVQIVKTTSRDFPMPPISYLKISGGMFHDCCVHDVDAICWLLGETPHTVFCFAHAFHPEIEEIKDVDTIMVVMKFPSGAMGQIDLSRHAVYGYDQRIEVFGGGGMVTSDNVPAFNSQMFSTGGKLQVSLKHSFCERYADSYVLEMNHFINVIRNKESLLVSKDDVIRSWNVVGAIEKSFQSGKPVTLP